MNSISGNWALLEDPEGVIYIANTFNGISTYDGQKIRRVFDSEGHPKLGLARAFAMDSHNNIYAIIGGEFGYIEKNKFGESVFYSLSKSLATKDQVNTTLWSAGIINDTVIFQSEKSVYLYKYKKPVGIQHFDGILHTINVNKNGAYLRIWDKGLFKLIGGKFELLPSTKELFAQNRIDEQYALDGGNNLLVSRNIGIWYLRKDGSLQKAKSDDIDQFVIKYQSYQGGEKLKNGIIPISTSKGGLLFIDDKMQIKSILNSKNGLSFDNVTSFIQDRAGDVWGASDNIFRVSFDTSLTYFSTINNLHGFVESIDRFDGKLYVRTNKDLFRFVPKSNINEESFFEKNNIYESGSDMLKFDDQIITTNNYTIKTTKNGVTKVLSPIYRSNGTIRSILNPSIIFSSNSAIGLLAHQYKNGQWKQLLLTNKDTIKCGNLLEVAPGTIILETRKGLYKYVYSPDGQGVYTKISTDKSFTTLGRLSAKTVNGNIHLFADSLNHFYRLDLEKNKAIYTGFTIDSFVNKSYWFYTYNPASKNGWMVTEKGIYKTYFDFKKGFTFKQYPFYKVDLSELSPGLFAEGEGDNEVLWLGSQDEKLYRYFPELAIKEKHQNFKALIRAIYANGQKAPLELGTIPFSSNNLLFEVAYPVFGNESKTTFSYWLEGQDSSWSSFVSDFKKEYTNLKEGKYTFHVRAKDASGEISEQGVLEFKISPPWYRTIWAYGLYLLLLVLAFLQFGKYQAKKSFLKAENERKNSELAAAKDLQNRLLPKVLPSINNLDIAGYLRTSTEVGGDYYDFFEQPDGSLYAICGDATGHGTPSGMLVSITKAGIIGLPQMSPNDMLHELNRVVKKVDLGILRMSLNIALLKNNELILSSAGMPPYYIYRAATKTTEEIQISGVPLGSFNDAYYDQISTSFDTGDILVIISDGLPEAPNLTGDLFDYQKLQDLITTYGHLTAQEVIDQLMIEADAWLSGKHNPDDITLVVIKHK
ncbi:MAG: SpoIIE family protein phosphatase [Bacteroidota bacterium]|nr:SpoIIE family protein phosphatase [Bacteroidota bacterium]